MSPEERIRHIRARLPGGGLFAEGEWQLSPHAFPLEDGLLKTLDQLGVWLARFQGAADTLYRRSLKGSAPAYIAEWLERGKPDDLIAISRATAGNGDLPSLLRPDLLWTEDGLALTEIDSLPGGSGATAWMNEVYGEMGDPVAGEPEMAGILRDHFRDHDVVISREADAYRPEFTWLYGEDRIHAAESYRFGPSPVYRFFEGFDWPGLATLRESWSSGARMDSPLKVHLEEKAWLALFWLAPLESFWRQELGSRYDQELRKIIPYTWMIEPVALPPTAVLPRLGVHGWEPVREFSKTQRDLVIKLSGFSPQAWGSRSVNIGSDMTGEQWAETVDRALGEAPRQPWVMQEFRKARRVTHPVHDPAAGTISEKPFRARLCPFYRISNGRSQLLGVHVTLCPPDKKRIHGMEDAVIVPGARAFCA